MSDLFAELTPSQVNLLRVIWGPMQAAGRWPNWNFVQRTCHSSGIDAEAALRSMPTIGSSDLLGRHYSAVWFDHRNLSADSTVRLTLAAGLHLPEYLSTAEWVIEGLRELVVRFNLNEPHPYEVKEATITRRDLANLNHHFTEAFVTVFPELLRYEPFNFTSRFSHPTGSPEWDMELGGDLMKFEGVNSLEGYVHRVADVIAAEAQRYNAPVTDTQVKHVFVSYVREDKERVDNLCSMLEAAQIPYWRDLNELSPGDEWKRKVGDAIRSGALVFLACFSETSVAKHKSYMNEEVRLAIEEFRLLPPEATWIIPIRFDDVEVPRWELDPGRTMQDLNYADLFGDNRTNAAVALLTKVGKIMRIAVPESVAISVPAKPVDRVELSGGMQGAVEDMILDAQKAIVLDKLISREARQVLEAMRDAERFPDHLRGQSDDDHIVFCAEAAADYSRLIEQFCVSLQVAARWGDSKSLASWMTGLKAITAEALQLRSGHTAVVRLRYIPALTAVFTAALASVGQGRWDNFKSLLVDVTVQNNYGNSAESLIQAVTPMKPFEGIRGIVPSVLARSVKLEEDFPAALAVFRSKASGEYFTPVAEWLHTLLRPHFADQYLDEVAYDDAFDRAEVMLGLVSQDLYRVETDEENSERRWYGHSGWYGRSTWRAQYGLGMLGEISAEAQAQGRSWAPLQAGLFGGQPDRVAMAIERYKEDFETLARQRF